MKTLLTLLLLAASAFAQTATITDTIATPFAGTFSGTVTVTLNSPALAQPLYSGSVTLSGWTQAVTVTAGVFTLTLYTNDLITPGGTSYTATYAPTSGSGWKETWIVPTGATTIREIRSTTVPSPSVRFTPSQITQAGATLGQGLRWNGSIWAPAAVLTDPMTTTGDLITRSGINAVRVGIGSTNQVLTVSGGMPVWASGITGNASTATALAANGTNCSAGSFPLGVDASGNAEGCTAAVTASTGLSDSAALVRNNQANTYTAGNKQTFASNATTAGAAFGGGISADPSSVSAGDFWYRTDLGTFGFRNATAVDALVAGGRALSTVGSVPFVTSSGVLTGSSALTFATSTLTLNGASFGQVANTTGDLFLTNNAGAGNLIFRANGVEGFRLASTSRNLLLGTTTDDGANRLQVNGNLIVNGGNALRLQNAAGNQFASMILNSEADVTLNYPLKLGSSNSVSTGFTLAVHNGTPTTGSSSLVVRAGAGQSSTNLTTWQNAAGTTLAQVGSSGGFLGSEFETLSAGFNVGSALARGANNFRLAFSSTSSYGGAADLSLSRASANTLQVGDGSANANGTILARIHTWANGTEGTCDATLRGQVVMVQGGAGVADRLRLCRKDATDTYLWAPVDNNVALQVVSAGPAATVTNQVRRVYVDPASVIASLTLTLPAAPLDADQVQVYFGGTLANQAAVVTTLTISPNTGHAISQFNAPANAFGGDMVTYEYRAAAARWYRIQ